jgi:hypothetical protein
MLPWNIKRWASLKKEIKNYHTDKCTEKGVTFHPSFSEYDIILERFLTK